MSLKRYFGTSLVLLSACGSGSDQGSRPFDVSSVYRVKVETNTQIFARLVDNPRDELADLEKCSLKKGSILYIEKKPELIRNKFYFIKIIDETTCPFSEAYVYGPHINYPEAQPSPTPNPTPTPTLVPTPVPTLMPTPIPTVGPNPVVTRYRLRVTGETWFKRYPAQSRDLNEADKCKIQPTAPNAPYFLSAPKQDAPEAHFKVKIASDIGCSFKEGYFYDKHVEYYESNDPIPTPTIVPTIIPTINPIRSVAGEKIFGIVQANLERDFRRGVNGQDMNFVREMLAQACGTSFRTAVARDPWDNNREALHPGLANSLAGDEFGAKIQTPDQLQAGDIVFLKNTQTGLPENSISHVGIATGQGLSFVDRPIAESLVKVRSFGRENFFVALRVSTERCQ